MFQKGKTVIAFTNSNTVPRILKQNNRKTDKTLSNSPVKTCYVFEISKT